MSEMKLNKETLRNYLFNVDVTWWHTGYHETEIYEQAYNQLMEMIDNLPDEEDEGKKRGKK